MHISRKLRWSRLILVAGLLFVASALLCNAINGKAYANEEQELQKIIVRSGDTLWNIIEANYDQEVDVRKAIYEVKRLNDLSSSELYVGQVLYLPQ